LGSVRYWEIRGRSSKANSRTRASRWEVGMEYHDYLRSQAEEYRLRAEQTDDPFVREELLGLAAVCEEVANNIEDRLTAG
jgi:hypothetical protein